MEDPQLNMSQEKVCKGRKNKSKLEPDVAAIWCLPGKQCYFPNVPRLTHTSYHPNNAATESQDSSNAWRQALGMIIVFRPVSLHATLKVKVVGEGDTFVDGQPVPWENLSMFSSSNTIEILTDKVHKVFENSLKVAVSGNRDGDVHAGGDKSPDETRHPLRPPCQHLHRERN